MSRHDGLRLDLALVADQVFPNSRVLDLGCGEGVLLEHLMATRGCRGTGVEIDPDAVLAAIRRGVPVIEPAAGEPGRLARPVLYAVVRGDIEPAAMNAWLLGLVATLGPLPEGRQQAAWWRNRANLENFLHALGNSTSGEQATALVALAASARTALQKLP